MAMVTYAAASAAAAALSAATAKTVIGVQGASDFGIDLRKIRFGFDGVTNTNAAVAVELCTATFATNPPGTSSTAITPLRVSGGGLAATGFLAASNWTTEPTVLAVIDAFLVTPFGGTFTLDYVPGIDGPDSPLAQGLAIRLTAPNAVNVRPTIWFGRC